MNTLLDQIIIYLLCASFWFSKPVSLATVILFLSVLLCGNLMFLSNSSKFSYALFAGLIILSFLLPDLFYFYPYILYEIQSKPRRKSNYLSLYLPAQCFTSISFRFPCGCIFSYCLCLRPSCKTRPKRRNIGNRNTVRQEMKTMNILMI